MSDIPANPQITTNSPGRLGHLAWTAAVIFVALILSVPVLSIFVYVFVPSDHAWVHLLQTNLGTYTFNTVILMISVGILAAIIGVSTAWIVAATDFPGRNIFRWLLVLPLAAPAYVIAYMYTDILSFSGPVQSWMRSAFDLMPGEYWFPPVRSLGGAAVLLALVLYPYVYLLALNAFSNQTAAQFEAARMLGKTPTQAFFLVALPGARPAIAGGLALVLMETLADFGVVDYFAIPTLSTGIFRTWFAMGEKTAALKLAGVMLLVVAILVTFEFVNRKSRLDSGGRGERKRQRINLSPWQNFAAALICGIPVVAGFAVPVGVLIAYSLSGGDQLLGRGFLFFARNSVTIAITVALLATAVAFLLAYVQRKITTKSVRASVQISTLGYALPGTLLAVGLLGPIGSLDRSLTQFASAWLGWDGGLILTGTTLLLVYACVVRFLTVSFNSVAGGLANISPAMEDAARSLGSRPMDVTRRIYLPLLRPSFIVAGLLVFVDVMRELPATLILRPFNFETLATRVYRLASDERLMEASTSALVIVLVGLIPVVLLHRISAKR